MSIWSSIIRPNDGNRLFRICSSLGPNVFLRCNSNNKLLLSYTLRWRFNRILIMRGILVMGGILGW